MSFYESVIITRPELTDTQIENLVNELSKIIINEKGKVVSKENWGLRSLAYKIKNYKKGYYFLLVFNSENEAISELERNFRIDENIIRYLTTKAAKIPTEPSYIMKAKIEKENTENMLNETNLSSNEG